MATYTTSNEIRAQLDAQGVSESAFLTWFIADQSLQDICEYLDPATDTVKINVELALLLARQRGIYPPDASDASEVGKHAVSMGKRRNQ